jgi:hypothetical protein
MTVRQNNNYKGVLIWAVEIITFLFAAFGAFLTNFAPPGRTGPSFTVGVVSFVLLVFLLIITAIGRQARGDRYRNHWITAGVLSFVLFLPAAFLYSRAWERYTYEFPCQHAFSRHIQATDQDLTEIAKNWISNHRHQSSPCELEMNLPTDQIWRASALAAAGQKLMLLYAWLASALATALFSLIEANAPQGRSSEKRHLVSKP